MNYLPRVGAVGLTMLVLTGCAGLAQDGGQADVSRLTQARLGTTVDLASIAGNRGNSDEAKVAALLAQPLTVDAAIQIALLNNASLKVSLAELSVAHADLVQSGRLRNPGFEFARMHGGGDSEIERSIGIDIAGLLMLPTRQRIEQGRFEQAKFQAAGQAVQLAAATRRAYFTAVAATQTATIAERMRSASAASSTLAESMAKVGNWSKLDHARERLVDLETQTQQARTGQEAVAAREQLVRLLGLSGEQLQFTLPERLPELPAQLRDMHDAHEQAMVQRLDLLSARRDAEATAAALGLTKATGFINVFDAGYANKSASGRPRENGYRISLELPIFDWGDAKVARAEGLYMQSVHRLADVAVKASSEVREAHSAYRTAYATARRYRDEVMPLRRKVSDEVMLRYNGMLASVFEVLSDAREQFTSASATIDAQRDFWIAESRLAWAVNGGSVDDGKAMP